MIKKDVRWIQRCSNYQKALSQLQNGINLAEKRKLTDLEQQGLIQAFEFTHELAWKTLKDFLEEQGNREIYGSKDTTRTAFKLGLITNGEVWMDMIKSRNQTFHTYNEITANEIVNAVKGVYGREFTILLHKLNELKDKE